METVARARFPIVLPARRSYASAVLGVVILSVRPSVTRVLCGEAKEPTGDIFIPHERAILIVFCAKDLGEIPTGSLPTGVPNKGG